ncbi:MAG: cobyric acid synthase [Hyphomicrobiaceae bacterium]
MIQGTGSNVGKSLIVAGLCRAFRRRGLTVRPFKPQNMSNNAAATPDGGEIGRAQALQARAAGTPPSVHMNPVLLKPESETGSQVIVQGHRWATLKARAYGARKHELLPAVLDSFERIGAGADLVVVEGAGSPAEVNLRAGDIANMGFAEAADVPVILVGDIDRGGVIASLVGCHAVLEPSEVGRIKAFLINRFRGDPTLFDEGLSVIEARTGWRSLGVVPYWPQAARLPAEDSVDLDTRPTALHRAGAVIHIAVPRLPRIANFDDLDPLRLEPRIAVTMVEPGTAIPGHVHLVILPGSKATRADLTHLRANGWDIDILAHVRRGGHVLGLCGGYQMLGRTISDPEGQEGQPGSDQGLGLLDVETVLTGDKTVRVVHAEHLETGLPLEGYEIHLGQTRGTDCNRPVFTLEDGRPDGAMSTDGRVMGTYVHGIFSNDTFRRHVLARLDGTNRRGPRFDYNATIETTLDGLADHLERHADLDMILKIARTRSSLT